MLRGRIIPLLALFLLTTPVFAQKVYIDYDRNYDGDSIETFAWATTPDTSLEAEDPFLHSRIVNGIEHYITMSGVREVETDADVLVTYHASSKEQLAVDTTHWGYGYPAGWGWGGYYGMGGYPGYGTSTSTVSTYEVGTLIVDVWDADTKELVWRGTAAGIMITPNPNKMGKRIDKALAKMVSRWERMKAKRGE